jgi:hypothetical protein
MNEKPAMATRLRKLGWLTLLAFTAKGVVTTSLAVWAVMSAAE